ncbi:energy coupling factor transporter S component ThiW [Staphylococcus kloosii]|uniref:Energy coupling factor transporter S component ThiW n=1 Tax=Staphylococcus kloosii TaxID=29384 RepID=A0A151A5G2_9STAP|nr:energy coupling factor transporter S component ThiW [Staphylococcus kloosii]AVQ36329.1 energy coupling factor transporter S component ThiW [Staphylococcus kloosii]KYH14628.1 energy coupling factor transporter S component ThiW [Staphylococcus kloosii]MBF7022228.1 energy coupling factor transporter S component ThiW [Staphylococcus kloosii]MBF7024100.1 energy coupling factor transporter S component ThiW [Staphylococcus kloosii]MBF7029185.1 energy coupling factor transporter S component ThiW [S
MNTKKLTLTAMFIAINVVLSSIVVIPLGPIKAAPVQHLINVLCAVFVGPWFGLAQAIISSVLRLIFGTGSAFAFPGSIIGVLLASGFYYYRKHIFMAAVGEVIGTGIIGSLMCIPVAWIIGLDNFVVKPLMLAFIVSSVIGSVISYIILMILKRKGLLKKFLS